MALVVVLLVLALIFGVGSVIKGFLWLGLIALVFVVVAGVMGRSALSKR